MKEINCYAKTCVFNDNTACKKDMIDVEKDQVQAVITAPTRELATQIYEHAKLFMKHNSELRVSLIIGGSDKQKTIGKLNTQPHIVIGTPGRIKDLSLDEQALHITTADIFVVDEAVLLRVLLFKQFHTGGIITLYGFS